MRSRFILIVTLLLSLIALSSAMAGETYFKFDVQSREEMIKLTKVISIDNVVGTEVYAYANDEQLARFESLGYAYTVLPPPSTLIQPKMTTEKSGMKDWDAYPTYDAYVSMMYQFEADYPLICDVQNVGFTVEGRELLFAKISDNVYVEENEPEVMHTGTMHGDETAGYVLLLRLIDSLLVSYGSDPRITDMINNMEVWINPNANPDGTYAGGNSSVYGATRYNANGYDLNRNFPDPEDGPYPGGTRQTETTVMMELAENNRFIISANFHGGAEVINYPWDTWSQRHADDSWWINVSRAYADTVHDYAPSSYMDGFDNGITNGYDWYSINGGRQDYMTYFRGGREVTAEISGTKLLPASQLPAHWEYNKRSLIDWLENARYGITGLVTEVSTGYPVDATITVVGHDIDSSRVFTDPNIGDYHRMIDAGTYDLEFSALGYITQTIEDIYVSAGGTVIQHVQMELLLDEPLLSYVGNDAGLINPGDAVAMHITLRNDGGKNADNVSGTLSTADTLVTITQDFSTFPNIAKLGGQAPSNNLYMFDISPSCPLMHSAEFELYVEADGGYVDTVTFNVMAGQQVEDFETGAFAQYPWEMGGDQPWTAVTSGVYEGAYCAKSGDIGDYDTSSVFVTLDITSGGTISFYYKVSSESGWDYLEFFIDGSRKDRWSGEVGWTEASYSVTSGTHTFKWQYMKDGSQSNGGDCGWVDYIIFPAATVPIDITTEFVPDWTIGVFYSQQLVASGGSGQHTWSDLYGDLDGTGLSLSTSGLLSGTATSTGTISFTAHVEDNGGASDDQPFSFTMNAVPEITTTSLPDWTEDWAYSTQLQSTGGTGVKGWSDLNDDLAGTGLSLTHTGLLSGTPATAGTISLTVHLEDEAGAYDEQPFSFSINPPLEITATSPPDWTASVPYSAQLQVTGGTGTMIWSDPNNHLSGTGLSLLSSGLLSGIPNTPGLINFTAHIDDEIGAYDNQPFSFTINPALSITTLSLPSATVDEPYSEQLEVTGGTGDKVWSDLNDDLVGTGLSLSTTGLLTGIPSSEGSISFTARVEDEIGADTQAPLSIEVGHSWICGDANASTEIDIDDVVYLIAYVFSGGPAPEPLESGDVDCTGEIDIDDVVYVIQYIFAGGPAPCADCP